MTSASSSVAVDDAPPAPDEHPSAPVLTADAIASIATPLLRKIKHEISIFMQFAPNPPHRALLDALKTYEANAERPSGTYAAYDLARDACEACKLAMVIGTARQRAWACACVGAFTNINAIVGRCVAWRTLDENGVGCGIRPVGDAEAASELIAGVCGCVESAAGAGPGASASDADARRDVGLGVIQVLLSACASPQAGLIVRGEALMHATRTVFHMAIIGDDEASRTVAKTALTQIINATFKRAFDAGSFDDAYDSATASATTTTMMTTDKEQNADDVLMLLLTLCKVAAREGAVDVDAYLAHSKALALDILRQLMDGPRAATWLEYFQVQLSQPLSLALMRNALLQVPRGAEAEASVGILVSIARMAYGSLATRARGAYKQQVAALYPIMALHPLQSDDASTAMRVAALRLVRRLASDSQALVDIFVNYDCDLHAANLYERTAMALAGAARVSDVLERDAVLTCLFSILRSLQSWHARGNDDGSADASSSESVDAANDGFDGELMPAVSRKVLQTLKSGGTAASPIGSVAAAAAAATVTITDDDSSAGAPESPSCDVKDDDEDAPIDATRTTTTTTTSKSLESESVRFQKAKQRKVSIEKAVEAFNAQPTFENLRRATGDAATTANAAENADHMAELLRKPNSRLTQGAIGEFLGAHDADALAVMRAYAHTFDFTSIPIDDALRTFLGGFKLPGEAQKIDRLMEAFAARFCACNPSAYPSSDAAYILAFAVVMLNTDAHNPLTDASMKMSERDFVSMAKAADATSGLDDEDVAAIYARVSANEIKMQHAGSMDGAGTATTPTKTKVSSTLTQALNFAAPWRHRSTLKDASDETAELLRSTKALFTKDDSASADAAASALFVRASEPGLARPMLDAAGAYMLSALASAFAAAPDEARAAMPLEGARAMLALASSLQLPTLRDDIRDFLVAAPGFGRQSSGEPAATQSKEALNTLLELVATESRLGGVDAWASALEIVSRLEELRVVVGAGVSFNTRHAVEVIRAPLRRAPTLATTTTPSMGSVGIDSDAAAQGLLTPAEVAVTSWLATSGGEAIERVFALSTRLDSDEIIIYASAIAAVSHDELWRADGTPVTPGKLFALLRLTEVAATNMTRVRLVWSKLWSVVADHLIEGVTHPDEKVVMHATDSLRQVANRLLSRARATRAATHHADAVRPFVSAMRCAPTEKARDLVASCVAQALQRFGETLGAGWEPAIEVLELAARDDGVVVVANTFRACAEPLANALAVAVSREGAAVDDDEYLGLPFTCVERAVRLLGAFALKLAERSQTADAELALGTLTRLVADCRARLATRHDGDGDDDAIWVKTAWIVVCNALGALTARSDRALDALFNDVLDSSELDGLSSSAWDALRVGAVEATLNVKFDATRVSTLVIPQLTRVIGARKRAYDALSPSLWVFLATALRSSDPSVVPRALALARDAAKIVLLYGGDDDVTAWEALCNVLRAGVTVDEVMLDLPNASDVVNRSMACVEACDALSAEPGVPRAAQDAFIAIVRDAYRLARRVNDSSGGTLTRLEFAAGDALLKTLSASRDVNVRRECFLEHLTQCLVIDSDHARANDKKYDADETLSSNALFSTRERLAARALYAAPLDDVDCVRALVPRAVAMLRASHRAPTAEALAHFFETRVVRESLWYKSTMCANRHAQ